MLRTILDIHQAMKRMSNAFSMVW